jgi:hypothetical protein
MIGLLTEGLRSTTQLTLITQGLQADFVVQLILFCPPMFSIALIQNLGFDLELIQNLTNDTQAIQNILASLDYCNDN